MAQIKYKDEQRLRQWDLLAVIGALIVTGVVALIQVLMSGDASRPLLAVMALTILVLSGVFYYLNTIKVIAKYNEKSIKLSMMPVGTVKRKIKWDDVLESAIINTPKESMLQEWNTQFASLDRVVTRPGGSCLQLKLKNNETINIGCSNPEELKAFVDQVKEHKAD
jgi:hypothetical protein